MISTFKKDDSGLSFLRNYVNKQKIKKKKKRGNGKSKGTVLIDFFDIKNHNDT